jgi:hypothetical protein
VTNNTRALLDVTISCTGAFPTLSQFHLEALSRSTFKGAITGETREKGQTSTMYTTQTGKWIRTDCGSEKGRGRLVDK